MRRRGSDVRWFDIVPTGVVIALIASLLAWFQIRGRSPDDTGRVRMCRDLSGPMNQRVEMCLGLLPSMKPSARTEHALNRLQSEGPVASVGARIEGRALQRRLIPELVGQGFLGTDEARVAAALRQDGVTGLVVHRDLVGALDRDRTVLARLAYHDHLEWFELRLATPTTFVYAVRPTSSRLAVDQGEAWLRGLRARLQRASPPPPPTTPDAPRLIADMRLQGSLLAQRHLHPTEVPLGPQHPARMLDAMAAKLRRQWERHVEPLGHGRLQDRLGDVKLGVHLVTEEADVEPRSASALYEIWQLGVDGVMLREGPGTSPERLTYLPGSVAVTRSFKSADLFLLEAADRFDWPVARPWLDGRRRLQLLRDEHFQEVSAGGDRIRRLVRGLPETALNEVTDERVAEMLQAGAEWWVRNQLPDGRFDYKYWPVQNRRSIDYNEVRHIIGTRDLMAAWQRNPDPRYVEAARKAMDWLLLYAVDATDEAPGPLPPPPADSLLFRYPRDVIEGAPRPPNQKLGTTAVALLGWVAWARATGSTEEDERIVRMARFVKAMQEPDGRFRPYFVHAAHEYHGRTNDIVPGEALLALAEVADYTGDLSWIEGFDGFLEYYRPWFSTRAARKRPTGRWPHDTYANQDRLDLVQFGPWTVMAAERIHGLTGREDAAVFGLEVADWMIDAYQWSAARSPWPDFVGGYYKLPFELPAMQSFCYAEGTAAAYAIALRHQPSRANRYREATRASLRFLDVMQYDDDDSYYVARPEQVRGGVRYALNENKVRIDYVGHALSAVAQYLDARDLENREASGVAP